MRFCDQQDQATAADIAELIRQVQDRVEEKFGVRLETEVKRLENSKMRFVIVTGMSGAGKSTALKMMEDMGYFCVDNLPVPLIPILADSFTRRGRNE